MYRKSKDISRSEHALRLIFFVAKYCMNFNLFDGYILQRLGPYLTYLKDFDAYTSLECQVHAMAEFMYKKMLR